MSSRTGYEDSTSSSTNNRNGHKSSRNKKHKKKKTKNTTMLIQSSDSNEIEEEEYNEEEYEDNEYYGDDTGPMDDNYYENEEQYYDDWDENYEEYYDDTYYAQSPPKKKKYRESDLNIKPLSYKDAKKQKNKEIRDKYEKRYSKYDSIILLDDDNNEYEYKNKLPTKKKNKKSKKTKIKNKIQRKRDSAIELSVTNEIDDQSVQSKEISVFFNKKTKDQYDEFEMNTYDSTTSGSDSDAIANKYLNKNDNVITPAPDIIDKQYQLNGYKKECDLSDNEINEKPKPIKTVYIKKKKKQLKKQLKPSKQQKENDIIKANNKNKNIFTLKEFMNIDFKTFVNENDSDNFDIAKAICKYYDEKCGDTDTVAIVSDYSYGPNTAYWSKGDFNRIEKNCLGKYIMVYRAYKHIETTVKVKQDIFESCVKGICLDNLGHSQLIADKLDCIFGEGCHVSLASHDQFEVFCRYSDGYICEVPLPNTTDFVVAWRR